MQRYATFASLAALLTFQAGRAPAQQPPTGQTPTGKTPATQTPAGKTPAAQMPISPYHYSGMWGRNPWFYNENVRKELNLTDQQYQQLQQGYQKVYGNFEKGMTGLDRLTPQERSTRRLQMYNDLRTNYGDSVTGVLNPQQMNRWRQMELQTRGYGAFADPAVLAKLNLNNNQVQQLNTLAQQYNQKLDAMSRDSKTDRTEVARQYELLRKEGMDKLSGILTPQQQRAWADMTGQPINIVPSFGTPAPKGPRP